MAGPTGRVPQGCMEPDTNWAATCTISVNDNTAKQ